MHTDAATEPQSDALIASAQAHNVPIVSGKQMLTWLDGRNASSYADITWSANTLTLHRRRRGRGERADRHAARPPDRTAPS